MGNLTPIHRMMTILIFGAAVLPNGEPSTTLRRRVEAALAQYSNHPDSRFIPTGAAGRHGDSEAAVMARLLAKSGVPSNRILLEDAGIDTLSSVKAIYRLLREYPEPGHVRVATSAYHLPRCVLLLCLSGIPAWKCPPPMHPAAASWKKRWYWRLREVPAIPYDAMLVLWWRFTGRG